LGVLLWTLLEKAQTIDEPGKNASLKHSTGRDGYAVALALSGFLAKGFDELHLAKVEPQPVASPTCAACLPPTVKFELPEVMALPAGHGPVRSGRRRTPDLRQGSGLWR